MERGKVYTGTKLDPKIRNLAEEVAVLRGQTLSEYLRTLVIDDLERRNLLSRRPAVTTA